MDLFPIFYFLLQFWLSCTFSAEPQANINDIIRMGTWRTVTGTRFILKQIFLVFNYISETMSFEFDTLDIKFC